MADLYMTIDEYQGQIEGAARVKITGGNGADGKHWFPINSATVLIVHPISMETGAQTGSDAVQISMHPYQITRSSDYISGLLESLTIQPGEDGFTAHIVQIKPSKSPEEGSQVIYQVDLEHARFSSCQITLADGSKASENITMTYDKVSRQGWHSMVGETDPQTQGMVTYNVDEGVAESYVKAE